MNQLFRILGIAFSIAFGISAYAARGLYEQKTIAQDQAESISKCRQSYQLGDSSIANRWKLQMLIGLPEQTAGLKLTEQQDNLASAQIKDFSWNLSVLEDCWQRANKETPFEMNSKEAEAMRIQLIKSYDELNTISNKGFFKSNADSLMERIKVALKNLNDNYSASLDTVHSQRGITAH